MAQQERPTGVTIIAVLMGILGALSLVGGVLVLALSPLAAGVGLVLGLLYIVIAGGLWSLAGWAWTAAVVLQGVNVALGLFGLFTGDANLLSLVLSVVILVYLLADQNVRAAFQNV